jgi:PAS domain-containing protein
MVGEMQMRRTDGTEFGAALGVTGEHLDGQTLSLRWIVRDITERKCVHEMLARARDQLQRQVLEYTLALQQEIAERRAQAEQQKFILLMENSSEFIAMSDLDGRVLFMNPVGCRLLGLNDRQ